MQAKNAFENYINSDTKTDKNKLYWLLSIINILTSYIVVEKAVTDFFRKRQLKISLRKLQIIHEMYLLFL